MLLNSCFYTPQEEFINDIQEPIVDGFTLSVSQDNDTIYVFEETTIEFDIFNDGVPRRIADANLYVNEANISNLRIENNRITWRTGPWGTDAERFFRLRLEVFVKTNSNSLAEQLDAEIITLEANWIFHSDPVLPDPIQITSSEIEDGVLTVRWTPPEKLNFSNYSVHAEYLDLAGTVIQSSRSLTQIEKGEPLVFQDRNFVGGEVRYSIAMNRSNSIELGPITPFSLDPIDFQLTVESNQTLTISWEKIPIYGHAISAMVTIEDQGSYQITDLESTSLNVDFVIDPFRSYEVTFQIVGSGNSNVLDYQETIELTGATGGTFDGDKLNNIAYHQPTNSYIASYNTSPTILRKFNANTFELLTEETLAVGSFVRFLSVPQNGQFIYAHNVQTLAVVDPVTLSLVTLANIAGIIGADPVDGQVRVSENGKATVRWADMSRLDRYSIINLDSRSTELSEDDCFLELSPDGKFAFNGSSILKFENGSWSEHLEVTDNESCAYNQFVMLQQGGVYHLLRFFSLTEPFNRISSYTWQSSTASGSSLSPSYFLPEENLSFRSFDPVSGYIALQGQEKFYIYDYTNFDLKYSVNTNSDSHNFFWNNTLISSNGTYTKIDID